MEEPAAKRRRFFSEDEDLDADLRSSPHPLDLDALAPRTESEENISANDTTNGTPSFDKESLELIMERKFSMDEFNRLQTASKGDMQTAINMLYDGTWDVRQKDEKKPQFQGPKSGLSASIANSNRKAAGPVGWGPQSLAKQSSSEESKAESEAVTDNSMPRCRYIGSFGVAAWATRSGRGLLQHGEIVQIERNKIEPKAVYHKGASKALIAQAVAKSKAAASRRGDVIVRFTNSKGNEVGRLPRETANWVSTLLDLNVCEIEGTCVYAPERLQVNETVYLQLRCCLLKSAFLKHQFEKTDNQPLNYLHMKDETEEEKQLRLRQVALVKLFTEMNLEPSRVSETAGKHSRQNLIQAADDEEKKREAGGGASPTSSQDESEDGKELEQDQLDSLYKKAQSFDFNTPEAEPAKTFDMDLRPYQKQALHWMMAKEKDEQDSGRESAMDPLWEEYLWPTKDVDDKELPQIRSQDRFYLNPYSGELSLDFPAQKQDCLGGILADEMGLGKTIEMMSLIHTHRTPTPTSESREAKPLPFRMYSNLTTPIKAPYTTLVVAPMSLLAQWQSEAENASKDGTLRSMVYYGTEKNIDLVALCGEHNATSAPNVIITSYGVVLSEYNQVASNNGNLGTGLFALNFFRVILDEAHYIKNRASKTAKACYRISAEHRWALTGTPIVNRLEDLFSLVHFLRVEPWCNFSFWKTFITIPFESKNFVRALDVVQTVLQPLVLRRTKDMKTPSGDVLVPLPPRTIEIVEIELSKDERDVYDYIFTRAKRVLAENVQAGTVMKAYTSIFAQILRLRQSCCHPILTRNANIVADEMDAAEAADAAKGLADDMDLNQLIERFTAANDTEENSNKSYSTHVLEQIRDETESECPICAEEPMIERSVTGCWHSACKTCLLAYIARQEESGQVPRCFNCRANINARDLFEVVKDEDDGVDSDTGKPRITLQRIGATSSAKVSALITQLKAVRREESTTKSVVFSQFTSFLDLIEPALSRAGIPFTRLDGTMSQKSRTAVLSEFGDSPKGMVLLLSLRAGGVGLNLTMAKRVFMMDPWWSYAVEAQAIDRVHRMGQKEEVKVCRFIVKESVEERMLKVQERKKFIASSLGMMSNEEKKLQRLEDIRELLS